MFASVRTRTFFSPRRGSGGIGRRTSLRGWREQSRGGSSPPFRTKILIPSIGRGTPRLFCGSSLARTPAHARLVLAPFRRPGVDPAGRLFLNDSSSDAVVLCRCLSCAIRADVHACFQTSDNNGGEARGAESSVKQRREARGTKNNIHRQTGAGDASGRGADGCTGARSCRVTDRRPEGDVRAWPCA